MTEASLQSKLDETPDLVGLLRNQQVGPNVYAEGGWRANALQDA